MTFDFTIYPWDLIAVINRVFFIRNNFRIMRQYILIKKEYIFYRGSLCSEIYSNSFSSSLCIYLLYTGTYFLTYFDSIFSSLSFSVVEVLNLFRALELSSSFFGNEELYEISILRAIQKFRLGVNPFVSL